MPIYTGFLQLGAGLSVGLCGLAAGFAIGIVGDCGGAQQPPSSSQVKYSHLQDRFCANTLYPSAGKHAAAPAVRGHGAHPHLCRGAGLVRRRGGRHDVLAGDAGSHRLQILRQTDAGGETEHMHVSHPMSPRQHHRLVYSFLPRHVDNKQGIIAAPPRACINHRAHSPTLSLLVMNGSSIRLMAKSLQRMLSIGVSGLQNSTRWFKHTMPRLPASRARPPRPPSWHR